MSSTRVLFRILFAVSVFGMLTALIYNFAHGFYANTSQAYEGAVKAQIAQSIALVMFLAAVGSLIGIKMLEGAAKNGGKK